MGNNSPIVLPGQIAEPIAPAMDFGTIFLALVPLLIFLIVIYWGIGHKSRKKTVIEVSYNLIALQLLFFLLFPICDQPINCGIWAVAPVVMFGVLITFIYHRTVRETEHKQRVSRALREGHVELTGLLQGRLEDEIRKSEKKEVAKRAKKEIKSKAKPGIELKKLKEVIKPAQKEESKPAQKEETKLEPKQETEVLESKPIVKKEPDHKQIGRLVDRVINNDKKAKNKINQ